MADAPTEQALPMFYKDLVPLNSKEHGKWKIKGLDSAMFMQSQHAIPVTIDEFPNAPDAIILLSFLLVTIASR